MTDIIVGLGRSDYIRVSHDAQQAGVSLTAWAKRCLLEGTVPPAGAAPPPDHVVPSSKGETAKEFLDDLVRGKKRSLDRARGIIESRKKGMTFMQIEASFNLRQSRGTTAYRIVNSIKGKKL